MAKYRSDFVTNSSSSSFILSFRDEESVVKTLIEQFPKDIPEGWSAGKKGYLQQVIDEIKCCHRYTKEQLEEYLVNELYGEIEWYIRDRLNMSYEESRRYIKTPEGIALVKKQCNKQIDEILEKIGDDKVIVEIEHGDGGEGEDGMLEHEILPYLPCVAKRFSHH